MYRGAGEPGTCVWTHTDQLQPELLQVLHFAAYYQIFYYPAF